MKRQTQARLQAVQKPPAATPAATPAAPVEIKLTATPEELDIAMQALTNGPWNKVNSLIQKWVGQANNDVIQGRKPPKPPADEKAV